MYLTTNFSATELRSSPSALSGMENLINHITKNNKNIYCVPSLEPSWQDGSTEGSQ